MKMYKETSMSNFEPWSGAVRTYERLDNNNCLGAFEDMIDELYPDGIDETKLNDILWFDADWCYESVGLKTESDYEQEIDDLEYYIQNEKDEMEEELEDEEDEEERQRIIEEHTAAIEDYEEQLEDLREEFELEF